VILDVCGFPNSLQVGWGLSRCRDIYTRRLKSASHLGLVQIRMFTHSKAELEFSCDYQTISFKGQVCYRLTPRQAAIVRVVHQSPYCEASTQIIKKLTGCSQIRFSFRAGDGRKIWKKVIVPTDHPRGFYRLNLTPKND
jgi:hypothetical protein